MNIEGTHRERLLPIRNEMRALISQFPEAFEGEPSTWFRRAAMKVIRTEQNLTALPPEVQDYLGPLLIRGKEILREEIIYSSEQYTEEISDDERGKRSQIRIKQFSKEMASAFRFDLEPVEERKVSIDELEKQHPDLLQVTTQERGSLLFKILNIRNPLSDEWHALPLPFDHTMRHKGGPARVVLDIHAGAPEAMIAAELPWNDLDVVCVGSEERAHHQAKLLGVDPSGIEMASKGFDFVDFANSRDTDQNTAALGRDGLCYSDAAYKAAQTGHIEIAGNYIADKAIYNNDRYVYTDPNTDEKIMLAKQRGIMRLVKQVAEGKARTFSYKEINSSLDFGIYSLYLAKKWSKFIRPTYNRPERFGELLQNMFVLLQQVGQTNKETNVRELLEHAHQRYPFFDIEKENEGDIDVARWLSKKLIKQLDREFNWKNKIPSGLIFERKDEDTQTRSIGLNGFTASNLETQHILEWWPNFATTCREKTREYGNLHISPMERYFYEMETEMTPSAIDRIFE